jgi:hypothetical protein
MSHRFFHFFTKTRQKCSYQAQLFFSSHQGQASGALGSAIGAFLWQYSLWLQQPDITKREKHTLTPEALATHCEDYARYIFTFGALYAGTEIAIYRACMGPLSKNTHLGSINSRQGRLAWTLCVLLFTLEGALGVHYTQYTSKLKREDNHSSSSLNKSN